MGKKKETVPFIRHYSGTYAYYTRMRRRKWLRRVAQIAAILLLFVLGYFMMETLLQVSLLPPV